MKLSNKEYSRRKRESKMTSSASKESKKQIEEKFENIINAYWKRTLEFPFGQICKHLAICNLFDELEKAGYKLNKELVQHVVFCEDEEALKYETFKELK